MKARCISNKGEKLSATNLSRGYSLNTEFHLTVDTEYHVYGMCVFEGALSLLVFDDIRRPDWCPIEIFKITDKRMPADWVFNSWDSTLTGVWGYRELVMSREYFDQLAERIEPAIIDFHRQRERMDLVEKGEEG